MNTAMRRIEESSLNAWPALHQSIFDGWVLRYSFGYTKRANSANPLYEGALGLDAKIVHCEEYFATRGQPSIFRLTPFAPPELDAALAERGYREVDHTRVMQFSLDAPDDESAHRLARATGPTRVAINDVPLGDWLNAFCQCQGAVLEQHETHHKMLSSIQGDALFATSSVDDEPVACALGVVEHGFVGLFDFITSSAYRRQGHSTALMRALLQRARALGAHTGYLQVVANNRPAVAAYEKLGFADAYTYWYRIKP
ncbi:MAG: GNAT family N-acetyltransferase [Gammaproteobacteria bacterium]|nr:GNAT family N-acetyltransferase [Gammaproteobacteria bacterium]